MKKLLIIIVVLNLVSCTSLLDEEPETFISPESFYRNIGEATGALYGAYDVLPSMYRNPYMTSFADISSNSFKVTSASATDFQPFDIHSISPSNSLLTSFWEFSYVAINRANAVIDRLPGSTGDEAAKNIVLGEAKFLRALFYFNLVRLFGDVPLKLNETTSLKDLKLARTSTSEIYKQIIDDLLDAKTKLPNSAVLTGRANSNAARALLAKVYLTIHDFSNAAANAQEVINSGTHQLWPSYADAFKEKNDNGRESIFAVQFKQFVDGNNLTSWSMSPQLNNYVDGSPVFDLMEVTDELLNSYEVGDQRKSLNAVTTYTGYDGKIFNFQPLCFKYSDGVFFTSKAAGSYNNTGNSGVNYQILRYADVLLIFAEAENEVSGPTAAAYDAINKVRRRAFGEDVNVASPHDLSGLDKDSFRTAVWMERFKELPFEGNQWFDLIRTGRAENVLSISTEKTIYPIPQREMDVNDLLTQNPGYN